MAVIHAGRAHLYVPPAWCGMCAISVKKRKSCRLRSHALRRLPQSTKTFRIGGAARPAWQSLDMLHFARRAGQEEENPAGLSIVTPYLQRTVLAGASRGSGQRL